MRLQGRDLSLRHPPLVGDDVALLHKELHELGFTIPEQEVDGKLFGPATEQAVRDFQPGRVHSTHHNSLGNGNQI